MTTKKSKKGKKAETTLTRVYKGKTYSVSQNPDGTYRFDGKDYKSLTAIAKALTGYSSINDVAWFKVGAWKGGAK